jgi:sigma-E factor negative regulatory protein RseA
MNNLTPSMQPCELLSALADGELSSEELAAALQGSGRGADVSGGDLARWSAYHLIGDVLRSQANLTVSPDMRFLQRFNMRLVREPATAPLRPAVDSTRPQAAASNDESFRWKLVAGVASVAAVSAICWNVFGLFSPAAVPQLAQSAAPQQVLVDSPLGPVLRDARLEELLAAHRQLGGASALQAPSNFFRNAAFDAPPDANR